MPEESAPAVGSIRWVDLTGADAQGLRDFYRDVIGFDTNDVMSRSLTTSTTPLLPR